MSLGAYDALDAVGLARLVAAGEATALELLEAALARADARNARLNAIVTRDDAGARARARGPLPRGPLSGVPFLWKDLHAAWAGQTLTGSSRLRAGDRPGVNAGRQREDGAAVGHVGEAEAAAAIGVDDVPPRDEARRAGTAHGVS